MNNHKKIIKSDIGGVEKPTVQKNSVPSVKYTPAPPPKPKLKK